MTAPRLPTHDPRTLARDIPGMFEALFPHLVPGVITHLNRRASVAASCVPVSQEAVDASDLSRPMLFELSVAMAEQLLSSNVPPDWESALALAVKRQRRHFDARIPGAITEVDKVVALHVAENLVHMLAELRALNPPHALVTAPKIPGYQWISSTVGDFSVGATLIEVKCTNSRFSAADYRQIIMYWLLSYAGAVEGGADEWSSLTLMNPRRCISLTISSDQLIRLLAAGKSKVEVLELFATIVGERRTNRHI